jgi:diguanylate cyclase (GGDEF)-like protein
LRRRSSRVYLGAVQGNQTRIVRDLNLVRASGQRESLVMIYGARLGLRYELERERLQTTIGRDISADIVIEDDSVSRVHCRLLPEGDGWAIEDLKSTNGTYVAGAAVTRATLRDGDQIKVGSTIFKFLSGHNVEAAYHEEIYRMAIFDGLTQLHNRRYFEEFTEREIARCRRHKRPLSLLMFDVDHFKRINDEFGHLSGDHVLREMAAALSRRIRREELLARYAGDEFVVVLPETAPQDAMTLAETLRLIVQKTPFVFEGHALPVSISMGVGAMTPDIQTPAQLVAAADAALYRAKQKGRNVVSL